MRSFPYPITFGGMERAKIPRVVAIVDDDESMRLAVGGLLKAVGLRALAFESAEEFLQSGELPHVACLIADIHLPGMSGLELQSHLNAQHRRMPTVFITADGDRDMWRQASKAGAAGFLTKPFDEEVLLENIRSALHWGDSGPVSGR